MDHAMSITEILDALYDGCAPEWAEDFLREVETWAANLRASIEDGDDEGSTVRATRHASRSMARLISLDVNVNACSNQPIGDPPSTFHTV